eukprot:922803-Pelagomonas_calceolata.AAC.1
MYAPKVMSQLSGCACIESAPCFSACLPKVRLHRYVHLQGQLGGNTEACNQTWPKKLNSQSLDWKEKITNHHKAEYAQKLQLGLGVGLELAGQGLPDSRV